MTRRAAARGRVRGGVKVKKPKATESLAAVTALVQSIFDSMFQGQIDEKGTQQKKRRCGICEVDTDSSYFPLKQFISVSVQNLESSEIKIVQISRIGKSPKRHWFWKTLEKLWHSKVVVLVIYVHL